MVDSPNFQKVTFVPGKMDENFSLLLAWLGVPGKSLGDEEIGVAVSSKITSYTICNAKHGEREYEVGPGKYKSALLLHYLSEMKRAKKFRLDSSDYIVVRDFFNQDDVFDALNNPKTRHTTIHLLLSSTFVEVEVSP